MSPAFTTLDLHDLQPRIRTAAELARDYEETGVLVFPEFFAERELVEVRAALDGHFAPLAAEALEMCQTRDRIADVRKFGCDVIPWNPLKHGHPVFLRLHADGRMAEVTEAAIGEGYSAPGSLVMFSVGGGRGQAWHQDCPAEQPNAFNLNRLIYADDISLEDGAIVFVPGSHKTGSIPPGGHQDPMPGEVTLTPRAGTLVLLHGHVYHRVTPNLNKKPRTSINFRAFPKGVPDTVNCIGVYRNGRVNFCDRAKNHDGTPAETATTAEK